MSTATGNTVSNAIAIVISNTTAAVITANTLGLTVASNTFNLGSSNVAHTVVGANGYTRMPNGLLMQFGSFATVNTTAQVVTFATATGTAFATNVFSISVTSNNVATIMGVTTLNSTAFTIVSNNATAETAYWTAIGI